MCMDGKSIIYFSDFVCVNANHRCNSYASCENYGINRYEKWGRCTKGDSLTLSEGITTIPATGAYTNENKEMLMIVITRYELYELERVIKQVDPGAFTNVLQTVGVFGLFRKIKEDQSWSSF